MDLLLVILGSILLIVGIIGCFVPVLPGPIIGYFALLVLKFTDGYELSNRWLWIFGALAIAVSQSAALLDWLIITAASASAFALVLATLPSIHVLPRSAIGPMALKKLTCLPSRPA